MRALVISRIYADPANRGKLRALAGLGVTVAAAVPDRWVPTGLVQPQQTTWGDDGGVRTVPIPIRGSALPTADPYWHGGKVRSLLTDLRPDLVQIEEDPGSNGAAAIARVARRLKLPYVLVSRESLPHSRGTLARLRRNRAIAGAAGLVSINESAGRLALRGHSSLPHRTIPQLGVQLPLSAERAPHTGLSIGFVGRLIPEKGLDLLFRAAVKLVGRWTITVVGTGPAQEELEGLAERLGIAGRVTWRGALPRSGVDEVWPRLDVLIMPSRSTPRWIEVAPRAALDAMAHGIAVVGSAAGAIPETVGDAGLVVPEEDVGALAEALQRLHDQPSEHQRLGTAGRRRVMDAFTDAAIAERTLAFWRDLLRATA
ncbi:MAG TPA: glycosyltransferase family 4 protein [Gemmatimonadales bacterium]|nr:glycosyltransferase family 4 protein [Gemmatimonadales bacterium]